MILLVTLTTIVLSELEEETLIPEPEENEGKALAKGLDTFIEVLEEEEKVYYMKEVLTRQVILLQTSRIEYPSEMISLILCMVT